MGNKHIKPSKENRLSILYKDRMDSFKRGSWATSSFREKSHATIQRFSSLRREHVKVDHPDKFLELKREIYVIIQKSASIDVDKRTKLMSNIKTMMINPFMIEGLMSSLENLDPDNKMSYSSVMILGEFDIINISDNEKAFEFINSLLKSLLLLNTRQLKLLEYSISNDLLYAHINALEYIIKNTFNVPERQLILRGQYLTPIFSDLLNYAGLTIKSNILMWNKKFIKPVSDLYTSMRLLHCVTV
ncbi:hypothetical protein AKMV181 [Akhmeta virus]|uniref:Protein A47 n=1 Tax=Orthopoxvirus akhmetapox TaxID=2200830 RepID=A0A346FSE3_9POXV|nr:hypothetical protein KM542_gp181 [Akhmeta virus]AXN74966.1 hypothetical protein AKMV-88-181 [Akhmeta virus]AXN75186.1 hypothetical protein AKMV181 [Akhmeta virus]AXN75405.1 hypothetical protein AKMV-Vani-181 [Akhmeta virus]QEQ49512.1 Immunoprevalent protein [Akhmeta virus]QEQ49725.1 Immunoprevalent protein [Akhmeta virus]